MCLQEDNDMAAVEQSAVAGADPTFRSASLNTSSLDALLSKARWNLLVQENLEAIAPLNSIVDAYNALSSLITHPQYQGMIHSIAQRKPLTIPENNLKLEVQAAENQTWYLRQSRAYLEYFVKVIQDLLEKDPFLAALDFDTAVRSNKKIIPEVIMVAGKIINPVTQSVLSREWYQDHLTAFDTARTLASSSLWANTDAYIDYLTATGRV